MQNRTISAEWITPGWFVMMTSEMFRFLWGIIRVVTSNHSSLYFFYRNIFSIETNVVPRESFSQGFMAHFN